MAAHPSQIADESFFLALDDDAFLRTWGTEWFIRLDSTPAQHETWLFDDSPRLSSRDCRRRSGAGSAASGPTTTARTAPSRTRRGR